MKCTGVKSALTYSLGRSLYIPLTSRSNSVTLPETRGPGFVLPAETVASLCRVRDVEHNRKEWFHWCQYLDTQEMPQKLPPALERVRQLKISSEEQEEDKDGRYPLVSTLMEEIDRVLIESSPEAIVIAGEGEPTLRSQAVLAVARACRSRAPLVRLVTNGLISSPDIYARAIKENGVDAVSVALMTADPLQYEELMQPVLLDDGITAHTLVCEFIRQAIRCKLDVEITGVDRPDVDKEETEQLAASLGVVGACRWRPFFNAM